MSSPRDSGRPHRLALILPILCSLVASGQLLAQDEPPAAEAEPTAEEREVLRQLEFVKEAMASIPQIHEEQVFSPYFFVNGNTGDEQLPLKSTFATVDITGVIADVTLEQRYRNEGKSNIEAIYIFPASTKAAVHFMKMTIGERTIEAKIKKRGDARRAYEKAKSDGKTASLLEQQRPNVFQMSVANILPGDEIEVVLSYTELITPREGVYQFVLPTVVGPRYGGAHADASDEWIAQPYMQEGEPAPGKYDFDVRLSSAIPISSISCDSHDVEVIRESEREALICPKSEEGNGELDFILEYVLAGKQIESGLLTYRGAKESYFLMMMEPPDAVRAENVLPREYVFIMDVSGSMNGYPLEVSKQLVKDILRHLAAGDTFNILLFAGASDFFAEESVAASRANVERAVDWIEEVEGSGGTELLPALERALKLKKQAGTSRIVVVATDGYISVEKKTFQTVKRHLGEANLFAFGIGTSVNRYLVEGLARAGMGEPFVATSPTDAELEAMAFREYVSSPVLSDIRVSFDKFRAYDVATTEIPDLFASRPIIVYGKYRGKLTGSITVSGRNAGGSWSNTIPAASASTPSRGKALALLWARNRIQALVDSQTLYAALGDGEGDVYAEPHKRDITSLGLKYHLLTDYTSFVAIDTVIRADNVRVRTVRQALPLPSCVSNLAVGGYSGAGLRGSGRGGGGSGMGAIGLGSLNTIGHGGGGGSGYGYGRGAGGLSSRRGVAPRVQVRAGKAVVHGSLAKEVVQRVVRKQMNQIRHCYEQQLQRFPDLEGRLDIEFTIDAEGTVTSAQVEDSSVENDAMEQCVVGVIKRFLFPSPEGNGIVIVHYPFVFKPSLE